MLKHLSTHLLNPYWEGIFLHLIFFILDYSDLESEMVNEPNIKRTIKSLNYFYE